MKNLLCFELEQPLFTILLQGLITVQLIEELIFKGGLVIKAPRGFGCCQSSNKIRKKKEKRKKRRRIKTQNERVKKEEWRTHWSILKEKRTKVKEGEEEEKEKKMKSK